MRRKLFTAFTFVAMATSANAFEVEFDWGEIPLCTSGKPNLVENPRFILKNVPQGAKILKFYLTDRDVPNFDHGGGTVEVDAATDGGAIIEPGAFTYRSPCPPDGPHTYEWVITAKEKDSYFAANIGKTKVRRAYPE